MDEILYGSQVLRKIEFHHVGRLRLWLSQRFPVTAICGDKVRYGNVTSDPRNVTCRECERALNGECKP
jgi:hypothetical protein